MGRACKVFMRAGKPLTKGATESAKNAISRLIALTKIKEKPGLFIFDFVKDATLDHFAAMGWGIN